MKLPFHYYWLTAFFSILGVGAVTAAVIRIFPYIVTFPETPTGTATPTNSIMKIIGTTNPSTISGTTGTAVNTQKLGGFSGSEFVQTSETCTDPLKVWIGTDASGNPICGTKPVKNLTQIGTVNRNGGKLTIYQSSGTVLVNPANGTKVYNGDIVSTDGSGTGTVKFLDLSFVRLSTGTTVELSPSATATGTIASVILANGSLWGRILSSTGTYNLGTDGGGIIAAVRGTSLAIVRAGSSSNFVYSSGAWKYTTSGLGTPTFTVVDSRLGATAVTLTCGSISKTLGTTESGSYNIATSCTNLSKRSPAMLYKDSLWIRENTRKDIAYMSGQTESLVKEEQILTIPAEKSEEDNLCINYKGSTNGVWYPAINDCVYAYADYTTGKDDLHVAASVAPNGVIARKYPVTTSSIKSLNGWFYEEFAGGKGRWRLGTTGEGITVGQGTDMPNGTYTGYWEFSDGTIMGAKFTIAGADSVNGSVNVGDRYLTFNVTNNGTTLIGIVDGGTTDIPTGIKSCLEVTGRLPDGTNQNYEGYCGLTPNPGNPGSYTKSSTYLEKDWTAMVPVAIAGTGITITEAGQYVEYPLGTNGLNASALAGKTMVVNLADPIGNEQGFQKYILDLGNRKFSISSDGIFYDKTISLANINNQFSVVGETNIPITLPSTTYSQFVIGNIKDSSNSAVNLTLPLKNTINGWYIK